MTRFDLTNRILGQAARVRLQPLWRALFKASIGGLGYTNIDPARNGELHFLASWAGAWRAEHGTGPIVFDVGANEGEFTAALLALVDDAEVHCFEPHPETAARLRDRFRGDRRVVVNELGVADAPGTLVLHDHAGWSGTGHASFVESTFTDLYPSETASTSVAVTTIDAYLDEHGIARIDLMKIDVEGYERNVFEGMAGAIAAGRIGVVQFEFNAHHAFTGLTLHEIGRRFEGRSIHKLLVDGTDEVLGPATPYNSRIELYKYSNYVILPARG